MPALDCGNKIIHWKLDLKECQEAVAVQEALGLEFAEFSFLFQMKRPMEYLQSHFTPCVYA